MPIEMRMVCSRATGAEFKQVPSSATDICSSGIGSLDKVNSIRGLSLEQKEWQQRNLFHLKHSTF